MTVYDETRDLRDEMSDLRAENVYLRQRCVELSQEALRLSGFLKNEQRKREALTDPPCYYCGVPF